MFWTLASGVPIWTSWMIGYFYVAANGWVPVMDSISASPVWFVLMFFIIRFWQSFHFYWIHRLIHFPWLFKNVHHLHHRYFECNYGSEEIPMDRWFGSFHDGTSEATQRIRARKKRLFARKQA